MKLSLQQRILIFSLLVLTLTVAGNTWFSVENFRSSYLEGVLRRCEALANNFSRQIKVILDLGLTLEEISGLAERCQTVVNNDPEIAYCLIEDAAGQLLYHSEAPYPVMLDSRFVENLSEQISLVETEELGLVYDLSVPLYDFDDSLAGRVRVGFRNSVLNQLALAHLYHALMVLGGASIVMFIVILLFARRDLVAPIRNLSALAAEIEDGNFRPELPVMRSREFDLLAEALRGMAKSLQQRDDEIQRNTKELEEANHALQTSYEHLEAISAELGGSREMYRSLLEEASDAILVCDEQDNIIMVNQSAETFFGMPREHIEQTNYFSFLEKLSCTDLEAQFEHYQAVRPGASVDTEIHFVRPSDQKALLGWGVISSIVGRGRKRLVQVIVRDATREEETRLKLERAARELERLNQMKNTFLGLASHELKTPLTIIMGYLELLSTEYSDQFDESALSMVEQISSASERLAEIVRDMLDVSMLDSRTIDLVSQPINPNDLVRRVADRAVTATRQRGQTLELDLAEPLPQVRCDLERMLQAVGNLVGNAIKFTPDGGQITLRTRLVERARVPERFSREGRSNVCPVGSGLFPYVEIAIVDQGIGIAEEDQETIFEMFYEIGALEEHSSGKVAFRSRGAGLGLTIAKGVVAIHDGAIWVESPGYDPETMPGSTFIVQLPVASETPGQIAEQE